MQCKALVDDDGRDVGIQHGGAEGIFEAADQDRLIDERVGRPAKLAPFSRKVRPSGRWQAGNDQCLEIGSSRGGVAKTRREQFRHLVFVVWLYVPVTGML